MNEEKMGTPEDELRKYIMDPTIPKNEAEHWARGEIERLREVIVGLKLEWQFFFDMEQYMKIHSPMEHQAYINERLADTGGTSGGTWNQ